MAPIYSKNAILKGTVDYFCLVCETYLRSEEENIKHISKPIHKKNLDSAHYVTEFEEDSIRKVKAGYYCEYCNKLLSVMVRVRMHVTETSHGDNKKATFIERIGGNVVAFGNIVIDDKAWHGLRDDSCAVCNTEYDNGDIHRNQTKHIIKLIQTKVEIDEDKNIYRKIDDALFQCLTCNSVLALSDIKIHFEGNEHRDLYQKCCPISLNKSVGSEKNARVIESSNDTVPKENDDKKYKENDCYALPLNKTDRNVKQDNATNLKGDKKKGLNPSRTTVETGSNLKTIEYTTDEKKHCHLNETIETNTPRNIDEDKANTDKTVDRAESPTNETVGTVNANNTDEKDKNLKDEKNDQNNTKIKSSESKETKNATNNSSKSIQKRNPDIANDERKLCKMLKTDDYITFDHQGKGRCVLCGWIVDAMKKKTHVTSEHHKAMLKIHMKRITGMLGGAEKADSDILDHVAGFQTNNIDINLELETAVCRKCTVSLPFDVNSIKRHIATDKRDENRKDESKIDGTTASASKDDNETEIVIKTDLVDAGNKENSKSGALDGADGEETNEGAESIAEVDLQKRTMGEFVETVTCVKHMFLNHVVINKKICISFTSLSSLVSKGDEIKCLACDEAVNDVGYHTITPKHSKIINKIPIFVNFESEFIRELPSGSLHCGFCNTAVSSWSCMREHLNSPQHRHNRLASEWRFQMYSDEIFKKNIKQTTEPEYDSVGALMTIFI